MKHIAEEYGYKCNLLELTYEEYEVLEPFLLELGVRTRATMWCDGKVVIQADNPYKFWIAPTERKIAEEQLTQFSVSCYKH